MSNLTSNPSPEHDQEILAVGRQCSHTTCLLVDFLPFKCQHCANSFCAEHFKPESHNCSKYDEHKYNRVAPDCPLCNEPVPIPPGEDPNIRMERHLASDCSVMTGRSHKASASPKCSRPKCGKVLFAQIQCDKCRQKFCPEHRFPNSHNCSSLSSLAAPASIANTSSKASSQISAISASGLAAMRRAAASAKSAAPSSSTKTSTDKIKATSSASSAASGSKRSTSNPFSKTDR
jgi:predicted nucleic acid binding AN1-type Zn finger protein